MARNRRGNREGSALNPTPALPVGWVQTHLGPGRLFSVCDETVTVEMDWTYLVEFPRTAVILVKEGPR